MKYRITSQGWEKVSEDADPDWQSIATDLAQVIQVTFEAPITDPKAWVEKANAALDRFRAAGSVL